MEQKFSVFGLIGNSKSQIAFSILERNAVYFKVQFVILILLSLRTVNI